METRLQYTCPKCGMIGSAGEKPPLCHVCDYKVTMCRSQNGRIMETVEVCPECGREIRSVDGKQISSCVHRPLDFISFLESLTEEFTLVRREVPCPKCKAMISFNHVATTEAVERSVHCTSCLHANCVVVEGVTPEMKRCDYDTNGDGDCHRCSKLGGCKAIGGPFSKDVVDGSAQTQE